MFDTVTTGAANDIEQATRIARAMVTQYGMSEKFGLMGLETQESLYLTGRTVLNCGDATAAEIDKEVMQILKDAYNEAKELLSANRDALDAIAAFLIEKETITGKEFMEIFRRVKGLPDPAEDEKKEERIAAKTDEAPAGAAESADGAQETISVADGSVIELPMQGEVSGQEDAPAVSGEKTEDMEKHLENQI